MTLLMVDQREDFAIIFSDTLVVDDENAPRRAQLKVWYLPELNIGMTVTGAADVGAEWFRHLQEHGAGLTLEQINDGATAKLQELYGSVTAHHGSDIGRCTVHLFGFQSGKLARYSYSVGDQFEGKRHEGPAYFINPPAQTFTAYQPTTLEETIELATRLREEREVPIGGDLMMFILEDGRIRADRVHVFPPD
ncbi:MULTISPECIES: hypothetical protein [unclassified Microbacterium]|uniref:hypothetical protein n=1 Tax=unclassified Microbacterium TaxID=2609290 RepID=UPI00365FCC9F